MSEFKIDADVLSEIAEACALVASTDDSRPVLQCVNITRRTACTMFEVTDSYRLLRVFLDLELPDHTKIQVNAKGLAAAAKQFRSSKKSDAKYPKTLTVEVTKDVVFLQLDATRTALQQTAGDWPDTEKVVDFDNMPEWTGEPCGFNPKYLSDIGKIVTKFRGSDFARVDCLAMNPLKPSYWTLENLSSITDIDVEAQYILMPYRRS